MSTRAEPTALAPAALGAISILVVDDEDLPRRCFVVVLQRLGYEAEAAVSGEDALGKFDGRRHRLVLTDHRMPGMNGSELAERIKRLSPATPVVMCSGHLPGGPLPVDAVLEKPFSLVELRDALNQLLGAPRAEVGVV